MSATSRAEGASLFALPGGGSCLQEAAIKGLWLAGGAHARHEHAAGMAGDSSSVSIRPATILARHASSTGWPERAHRPAREHALTCAPLALA